MSLPHHQKKPAGSAAPLDEAYQKAKFTELRFEYYSSGRELWFSDSLHTGAMLLGYAVELSLKYALIAAGVTGNVLKSHLHLDLYEACVKSNALEGIQVSEDLLHHISDSFNQRYPSEIVSGSAFANARGHALSQNLWAIAAYDDLMIQIDDFLRVRYADKVSVGLMAAHFCNRRQGRAFFHNNIAALKNTDLYRNVLRDEYSKSEIEQVEQGRDEFTIQYNLQHHRQRLDTWNSAPASLWTSMKHVNAFSDFESCVSNHYARDFSYPGKIMQSSDGTTTVISRAGM